MGCSPHSERLVTPADRRFRLASKPLLRLLESPTPKVNSLPPLAFDGGSQSNCFGGVLGQPKLHMRAQLLRCLQRIFRTILTDLFHRLQTEERTSKSSCGPSHADRAGERWRRAAAILPTEKLQEIEAHLWTDSCGWPGEAVSNCSLHLLQGCKRAVRPSSLHFPHQ
jgi:hypothetical protein